MHAACAVPVGEAAPHQAQCCRQLIVLLAHQQAQRQECLHRRPHGTPVGIALSACKGRRCKHSRVSCRTVQETEVNK